MLKLLGGRRISSARQEGQPSADQYSSVHLTNEDLDFGWRVIEALNGLAIWRTCNGQSDSRGDGQVYSTLG